MEELVIWAIVSIFRWLTRSPMKEQKDRLSAAINAGKAEVPGHCSDRASQVKPS